MQALEAVDGFPDVVAMGGWVKRTGGRMPGLGRGYFGLDAPDVHEGNLFGQARALPPHLA